MMINLCKHHTNVYVIEFYDGIKLNFTVNWIRLVEIHINDVLLETLQIQRLLCKSWKKHFFITK